MEKEQITPIKILLVEDDPEDVELTTEVLEMSKVKLNLNVAEDGVNALEYLEKKRNNKEALPDLILLDLNMPRKSGLELLNDLKLDDDFKKIPVVILTTSDADQDIDASYKKGASCYVTKPVGLEQFQKVVGAVENFWFTVVKYPSKKSKNGK